MKKSVFILLKISLMVGLLCIRQPLSRDVKAAPAPQVATTPLRLGDFARGLSAQDIASLEPALATGRKPWLFVGDFAQARSVQWIQAYMPPDSATAQLRRGTVIRLSRRVTDPANPGPWTIDNSVQQGGMQTQQGLVGHPPNHGTYVQVAIEGRTFEEFQGDQDHNRPFIVEGNWSDAELISIVEFVRPKPPLLSVGPIQAVVPIGSNGSVTVWSRVGPQASEWTILQKLGEGWKVVGRGRGQA
jgi:hypothetical protein